MSGFLGLSPGFINIGRRIVNAVLQRVPYFSNDATTDRYHTDDALNDPYFSEDLP